MLVIFLDLNGILQILKLLYPATVFFVLKLLISNPSATTCVLPSHTAKVKYLIYYDDWQFIIFIT